MKTVESNAKRFNQVTPRLPVADLQRTMDFYTKLLGFEVRCLWPENPPTFLMLERYGVCLAFDAVVGTKPQPAESACGFYLGTEKVRAMHEQLRDKVRIGWGPEVYPYGCREFAIRDPDGYMIIFTEETDDPPTCVEL